MFYLLLTGILVGCMFPTQTAINSKLRSYVHSPLLSSLISFCVAEIFLLILTILMGINPFISFSFFLTSPKWIWLGGFFGVIALTSIIFLFQKLGSVQTVILPLIGQIFMGLIIDTHGWFHSPLIRLTIGKNVGVFLMLLGVFLIVILPSSKKENESKKQKHLWAWQVYGVVVGMLMASQMSINAELGRYLNTPIHASLVSFTIGTIILIILVGVKERSYHKINFTIGKDTPKWIWLGGILGGSYVLGTSTLVPLLGSGTVILVNLFGQMLSSLTIDHFGLFGSYKNRVILIQLIGVLIMVVGISLTKLF